MPVKEERQLKNSARKAGLKPGSKSFGAYVYGTMNKIQAARKNEARAKILKGKK
jgi:hypothetical protein